MKALWRNIHLYLSLAAGLVIMVVCFTGAVLVFEKEFQQSLYPDRYFVTPSSHRMILDSVVNQLEKEVVGASVNGLKLYKDPERSIEFWYMEENVSDSKQVATSQKVEGRKGKQPERSPNKQAFINPYNGNLTGLSEGRSAFFMTMFSLHRWLLIGDVGKMIVGVSTSIFLFIIITGIILWWPKTRDKVKRLLTYKWAGWKRINHDLHVVTGFYTAIFLFVFAFTGLAWSFQWFNNGIYWITGTENVRPEPPVSIYQPNTNIASFQQIYTAINGQVPHADYYQINKPKDSISAFAVTLMPANAIHERASDQYFFDQYTGKLIGTNLYSDRNLGQRVRSTFYPIHVGSIGGMPGRIIAFLCCIAGVTFPITGVIMWINRLNKKKKKLMKKAFRGKEILKPDFIPYGETIL